MHTNTEQLTYKKIFLFWLPLAATWLMMSVEGPFLSAIISRLAEPKYNLAAYGVAFAIALIVEAPIIMIMSASTALVTNRRSFIKLRNFTYAANMAITLLMLLFLIPPVFRFFVYDLMELPGKAADLTYYAVWILLPWPGAIGYRRFYQGILIRFGLTRRVAYGTIIRLSFMLFTALLLYLAFDIEGVYVGSAALSAGVIAEGLASKVMALGILKKIRADESVKESDLGYKRIFNFYYPLALTSILSLGVHPVVTFFMGQSLHPLESLAALPVINALIFIFRSLGLSYQEVGIALLGEKFENYIKLRNFAIALGIATTGGLVLIAFTPLSHVWYYHISGLSLELAQFAIIPTMIGALLPSLNVLINFQRAILVSSRFTHPLTWGTAIEVTGIVLVLIFTVKIFPITGAIAASLAYVLGRIAANIYLTPPFIKARKRMSAV